MTERREIPVKLPSLNEYITECRTNRFAAAAMKKKVEAGLYPYLYNLPRFTKPVEIEFTWFEETRRRDLDNVAFGKKFILDALVKYGKLENDNPRHVVAFRDVFAYGETNRVIIEIKEKEQ